MATSLSTQLAQVAVNSSNPLDLKAQKKAHSQSLIFDSKKAASQGFEVIYQICLEGFQELCQLDPRFTAFTRSIFSTQSQTQDRNHMTRAENDELNVVIDSFLCLVSARLLLKPAHQAVEWLVRRFRVHEHNSINLVLAFLPYHSLPIFLSLLSILPGDQPPALRWLQQYVTSAALPPKDAIVYAVAQNRSLFSAYNTFMLQSCYKSYHDRTLISCWAVVTTEGVASMIDQAKSGRREIQERNEHNALVQILPLLDEGLAMKDITDMRIACYIILTVVASKSQLNTVLLDALMDAVVSNWTPDSTHAGLICLAVLTRSKKDIGFAQNVFDAIMSIKTLKDDLSMLKEKYRIDKLVLGLVQGALGFSKAAQKSDGMSFIVSVFEDSLLDAKHSRWAIRALLSTADKTDFKTPGSPKLLAQLGDVIQGLSGDEFYRPIVSSVIQDDNIDLERMQAKLQTNLQLEESIVYPDVEMVEAEEKSSDEDFQKALQHIPTRTTQEVSFLAQLDSYLFASLTRAFLLCTKVPQDLLQFCNLPVLGRPSAMTEPLFCSFFFRVACSSLPISARVAALQSLSERLEEAEPISDLQMFFPYLLYNLCDPNTKVRNVAVDLAFVFLAKYKDLSKHHKDRDVLVLGRGSLYDTGEAEFGSVLSLGNASSFIDDILGPVLGECCLDAEQAIRRLNGFLRDTSQAKFVSSDAKAFNRSSRMSLLHTLASHIIAMPIYQVKLRLLAILDGVGKIGSTSRFKCLKPMIESCRGQTEAQFRKPLAQAQIDEKDYTKALVDILMPLDNEGLQLLRQFTDPEQGSWPPQLQLAAHRHIRSSWCDWKFSARDAIVKHLLELATKDSGKNNGITGGQALETLQEVSIPAATFVSTLESIPRLSGSPRAPSSPKRHRTSNGYKSSDDNLNHGNLETRLRATTIALELVENSQDARDENLLPSLFRILEDVMNSKSVLGAGLGYVLSLVLSCLHLVMETIKDFQPGFDRSKVRADLVVDGLKASTTPQSQNTALLLFAKLATVAPDLVVNIVIPIFTFMGNSVVNQTDEYSAHVIDKTIDSVIPPLLESLRNKNADILQGTSELLLSFVAAFEHMPLHRMLHLFKLLVSKLGPQDTLHAVLAMLLDKYRDNRDVQSFAIDLVSCYETVIRLTVMSRYIDLVMDSLLPQPKISRILALGEGTTPQANAVRLLKLAEEILGNSYLRSTMIKQFSQDHFDGPRSETARSCYSTMLENLLQMNVKFKADKALSLEIDHVIRALLSLFPVQEYTLSLQKLLKHEDLDIRRQAVSSLEIRLDSLGTANSIASTAVIETLPILTSLLKPTEDPSLKVASLTCINRIFAQFGKVNNEVTLATAEALIGDCGLGSTDLKVVTVSLNCLATATSALGEASVHIVPGISIKATDQLKVIIDEELEEEKLHNASYGFFRSLFQQLPWIVIGKTLEDLLRVSYGSANAELNSACDQARREVLDLLAQKADPKECFNALKRTWQNAVAEGPKAINEYFSIFATAVRLSKRSTILKNERVLSDTILQAFDLRRLQLCPRTEDSYRDEELDEVETTINQAVLDMIYRLSPESFRPMFSNFQEWSTTLPASVQGKEAILYRQTAWYKFLHVFFETTQALGTHYAGFIVEQSNTLLQPSMINMADSLLLLKTVISTLGASFKHDKDEFFQSHSYISLLGTSLIALIPYSSSLPPLLPALVSLATCTSAPEQRKVLNTGILRHFKSDDATIRLAAVKVQRGITEKCGEDWIMEQMAEISAAIVELREDDSEEVERELARWEKELEPILGEEYAEMLG